MNLSVLQGVAVVVTVAVVTLVTRALPFVFFRNGRAPKYILYLGKMLPYATIGMLIVYCLKSASFTVFPFALPELLAIVIVVVLHLWKGNTLLSVGAGTVVYMLLVQRVFA